MSGRVVGARDFSRHLLPVSAERLAKLPDGVALADPDRGYLGRTIVDGVGHVYLIDAGADGERVLGLAFADVDDTVTAAVIASCVVWPWLDEHVAPEDWRVVEHARHMEPLTPEQIDTLARLARAAMEAT